MTSDQAAALVNAVQAQVQLLQALMVLVNMALWVVGGIVVAASVKKLVGR